MLNKPWEGLPATGPILKFAEAVRYLGVSKRAYYQRVEKGELPKPIHLGGRDTGLPKSWLDAIIESWSKG